MLVLKASDLTCTMAAGFRWDSLLYPARRERLNSDVLKLNKSVAKRSVLKLITTE